MMTKARTLRRDTIYQDGPSEQGIVDTVILTEKTWMGTKLVKIKVRNLRVPELGDKFASRHGQKGVLGMICPQEDLPFTDEGLVPDLVINPHAMPSRMTLGQMFEGVSGKIAAALGETENATPFEWENMDDLQQKLLNCGFEYGGRHMLMNGVTGKPYDIGIYIGLVILPKTSPLGCGQDSRTCKRSGSNSHQTTH